VTLADVGNSIARKAAILLFQARTLRSSRELGASLVRIGSVYGGWWVPISALGEGQVAYCIGAGEDITFDIGLLEAGCAVRTCDPTPRAILHVERDGPNHPDFRFAPLAVWSKNQTLRFFEPRNPLHVSHSALNLQQTDRYIDVEARSLQGLLGHFGDLRMDLLKLDIEGAEHEVLSSLSELEWLPATLCVEFDQVRPLRQLLRTWRGLRLLGYEASKAERLNVLFVLKQPPKFDTRSVSR